MKIKIAFIILFAFGQMSFASEGQEELFKDESKLEGCRQDIPLTYKKKDEIKVAEKAATLKDKELVFLHYDKKTDDVTFTRYYLVSVVIGNELFNYLIAKDDYLANKEHAIFIKYTDKYDRFYLAECFDKVVVENADLKQLLKEKK